MILNRPSMFFFFPTNQQYKTKNMVKTQTKSCRLFILFFTSIPNSHHIKIVPPFSLACHKNCMLTCKVHVIFYSLLCHSLAAVLRVLSWSPTKRVFTQRWGFRTLLFCPSRHHRSGLCPWRLPVRVAEASVWVGARQPVLHSGLQRSQEEPGSGVPLWGRGAVLGARAPHFKGVRGQHEPERKAGPISFPISNMLE